MSGDVVLAGLPSVIAALVLWRGWRRPDAAFVCRWQMRFGVTVPPEEEPFVSNRLARSRRLRAACVALGVLIAALPAYMNLVDPARSASFANPLVGNAWLLGGTVGAVLAEVFVVQRSHLRRASLAVRQAADYVDRRFVVAVHAALPVTVALATLATVFGWWRWWESWLGVAGSVIASASVHFGVRAIVQRPALAPDGTMRDIDDALRADGAFRVVGAAVALAAASLTTVHFGDASGALAVPSLVIGYVSLLGLVFWWTLARDVKWSVRLARALR